MFEPEELMARIVDLEEQLKVSEMAPPAAEQLIACLEGEIAKRDEVIVGLTNSRDFWREKAIAADDELAALKAQEPVGWYTEDHLDDKSATTYSKELADRWVAKGWPVFPLYAAPVPEAKAQGVVMPEHETSTPSSKWASAGESDPHGKAYDCERAELSMGEYTDDELANAVFMHDHRSFDIAATMRGEPGSIVLLTAAKDRIRWLSRSLDKALARISAAPAAPAADAGASLIEWTKDAVEWGGALNYAAWEFVNECPEKSALLFNNTKGPLRASIMKYAEIVSANAKDSSHD